MACIPRPTVMMVSLRRNIFPSFFFDFSLDQQLQLVWVEFSSVFTCDFYLIIVCDERVHLCIPSIKSGYDPLNNSSSPRVAEFLLSLLNGYFYLNWSLIKNINL
jgi:hypothetical protein